MKKNFWLSIGIIITLGYLLGMLGFYIFDKVPIPVEKVAWSPQAQWISTPEPSYRMYLRKELSLNQNVKAGWLRISADNKFVLYVNGNQVVEQAREENEALKFLGRKIFLSQRINDIRTYNVITEFLQLAHPRNWKLTCYVDLTNYLQPGKNVIAVEVQDPQKNSRVVIEGRVYPVDQETSAIDITTGVTEWKVSNISENLENIVWYDILFPATKWKRAKTLGPVTEFTYSRMSQHLFDRVLDGYWISGVENPEKEEWLRGNWQVSSTKGRAFIRLSGEANYSVLINGVLIKSISNYLLNVNNTLEEYNKELQVVKNNFNNQIVDKKLYLFEVTNLLHPGSNSIEVKLSNSLDSTLSVPVLKFLMDGWVETEEGKIIDEISSDSKWVTFSEPIPARNENINKGKPVLILGFPDRKTFVRLFEGDGYLLNYPDYLWRSSLWQLGGIACAFAIALLLGRFLPYYTAHWQDMCTVGAGLLLPGTLFVIGMALLKHRYAESERGLIFAQPQSNLLILIGFASIVILTLLWSISTNKETTSPSLSRWGLWFVGGLLAFIILGLSGAFSDFWLLLTGLCLAIIIISALFWNRWSSNFSKSIPRLVTIWRSWGHWVLLTLIILVGLVLRTYDLGATPRDSDESTSLDAIRGILRTGSPVATSGIWYTRGPFFHYLVAFWLRLVGYSYINARFFMAIIGTATLILIFIFTRKITGNVWIALLATALLAIDPRYLTIARNTRFYQLLETTTLLSFWFFYKGFIYREGKKYQSLFFVAMTLSLLTQEGSIIQVPCFLLGFICFYRPFFRWSEDWPLLCNFVLMFSIYIFNGIFFIIKCLTPSIGLSAGSATPIVFHLFNITGYAQVFFAASGRLNTLYSLFFILGFIYFIKRPDNPILFLFISVLFALFNMTIFFQLVNSRYTVPLYTFLVILAVYSAFRILEELGRRFEFILNNKLPLKKIALIYFSLFLLFNIEPSRVLDSYKELLVRNEDEIFEYIRDHRQPGDVVISSTPPLAAVILNGLDYYAPSKSLLFLDSFYWNNGRLVERWAGGTLLNNIDQLNNVLAQEKRIWIQIDDVLPSLESELKYFYYYIRNVSKPVLETYGVQLRMWERGDVIFKNRRNKGQDLGSY